jgi:hypothetical protein
MARSPRRPRAEIPEPLRTELGTTRDVLLTVHKALLELERLRYERQRGAIENNYLLLQLVISDPWFAWLHPVSELVVQIDVLMESRDPLEPGAGEALVAQARTLLDPDPLLDGFRKEYHRALQESPEVVLAHADAQRRLSPRRT